MKVYEMTTKLLGILNMKGISSKLDEMINDAETQKHSYITFLNSLLHAEIENRRMRRIKRNMSGAHFPIEKRLDNFDYNLIKGICKSEVINL